MVEAALPPRAESSGARLSRLLHVFLALSAGVTATFLVLAWGLMDGQARLLTAFLLKVADVVGVAPALDHCAGCGARQGVTRFSFAAGGALCERCCPPGSVKLRPGLTAYLAALAAADLGALPAPDASFGGEAMGVIRRFLEYHLDRRLESLATVDG